jgi:hypothetical protein
MANLIDYNNRLTNDGDNTSYQDKGSTIINSFIAGAGYKKIGIMHPNFMHFN